MKNEDEAVKLIAVVPFAECDSKFLCNLKAEKVYQFYSDYTIQLAEDGRSIEVFSADLKKTEASIYTNDKGLDINISALVGKNGSGKSSLLELLYFVIYKISSDRGYVSNAMDKLNGQLRWFQEKNDVHSLHLLEGRGASLDEKLEKLNYKSLFGFYTDLLRDLKIKNPHNFRFLKSRSAEVEQIYIAITNTLHQKIDSLKQRLKTEEELNTKINESLNVSILFSKGTILYELRLLEGTFLLKNWSNPDESDKTSIVDVDFTSLFYTISINYSHHSLNSDFMGVWLDALFHKNDGYKTPIVINPMRHHGNFIINKEEGFARVRLLSNLISARLNNLDDRKFLMNEKQNIIAVHFQLKEALRFKPRHSPNSFTEGMNIEAIIVNFFLVKEVGDTLDEMLEINYSHILIDYFVEKFFKITETYDGYKDIEHDTRAGDNPAYVEAVHEYYKKDKSHVTFKLKQVIHYFKTQLALKKKGVLDWQDEDKGHLISVSGLIDFFGIESSDSYQGIIEKLPPAIFELDFIFSEEKDEEAFMKRHLKDESGTFVKNAPRFGSLSSGEKQLIHSVQTILYHLSNLNSVDSDSKDRLPYSHLNIIFDEIELYFHPDLQRRFIQYMVSSLNRIKPSRIKGINVIFATHSPFILSDIPSTNILRLKDGEPQPSSEQTFGANIHDLLANDFFLKDGFMGDFVKDKINEVITCLNHERLDRELKLLDNQKEEDKEKIKGINGKRKKLPKRNEALSLEKCLEVILLIGEPALRDTLLQQHHELVKSNTAEADTFIQRLAKEMNYTIEKKS